MKKIYFDLTPFELTGRTYHGGSEYAMSTLKFLLRNHEEFDVAFLTFDINAKRPRLYMEGIETEGIPLVSADELKHNEDKDALLFSALPSVKTAELTQNYKSIFVCHGLRSIECPVHLNEILLFSSIRDIVKYFGKIFFKNYYIRQQLQKIKATFPIENANLEIIFPSAWSKSSFNSRLTDARAQMHVLPPPITKLSKLGLSRKQGRNKRDKIILLSADRWVKNVLPYLTFLGKNQNLIRGLNIYYTGKLPPFARFLVKKYQITHLPDLTADELSEVLCECKFVVYPSLNEGFGYPVIEGIAHGATVLTTGVSALGEHHFHQLKFFNGKSDLMVKLQADTSNEIYANDSESIANLNRKFEDGLRELLCK